MGSSDSVLAISPELTVWVATEERQAAAVLKERRKAREERELANTGKKQGGKKEE